MRLLTVRDIGVAVNKRRNKAGKQEMPYLQVLKTWNDLRKSNKAYAASGMVGLNYVFTIPAAKKVADAIFAVDYRSYQPRKPKTVETVAPPLNEAV